MNNQRRPSQNSLNINTTFALFVVLAVLILINFAFYSAIIQKNKNSAPVQDTLQANDVQKKLAETLTPEQQAAKKLAESYDFVSLTENEMHLGSLSLVNSEAPYQFDNAGGNILTAPEIVSVYGKKSKSYFIKDNTIKLALPVIEKLNLFLDEYGKALGKNDILINSAYRTYAEQEEMLKTKKAELGEEEGSLTAAVPGSSEHHTGLAFDISIYSNGKAASFTGEGDYSWIPQNCYKYGFILRYPNGKTNITGITYEPWHFRYVGNPHAYYISKNGLTLEEYITQLKKYSFEKEHLTFSDYNGDGYEVYYVASNNTFPAKVPVPKQGEYTVSGNNLDGFIITVKK